MLPEFNRHKAWSEDGQRSCVARLNAHCGMSPSAAHDRRRVAYALEELPVISQLFQLGELNWSKVRALTCVATPENERELASQALILTQNPSKPYVKHKCHIENGPAIAASTVRRLTDDFNCTCTLFDVSVHWRSATESYITEAGTAITLRMRLIL